MKQLITFLAAAIICSTTTAQTDSTKKQKPDTIRIGGIIIVKNGKNKSNKDVDITMGRKNSERKKNAALQCGAGFSSGFLPVFIVRPGFALLL